MSNEANLVAGRLGPVQTSDRGQRPVEARVRYGVWRLGLRPAPRPPVHHTAHHRGHAPSADLYRKGSYKLPKFLVHWLKAYAQATNRYQYNVVTQALEAYMASSMRRLRPDEREELAILERQYDTLDPCDGRGEEEVPSRNEPDADGGPSQEELLPCQRSLSHPLGYSRGPDELCDSPKAGIE